MTIGKNIKRLRQNKGMTQERLAQKLGISAQAVSKWEKGIAFPDISLLPVLADDLGVSIDELMDFKLNAYTNKERFIKFMFTNNVLCFKGKKREEGFILNSENFETNEQIAKIGEAFADCIRENDIEFDTILGLAYHGIAFSLATAYALFDKYGMVVNYCHERKVPDSRGKTLCGYTLKNNDKVIIIDDFIITGNTLSERMDAICENTNMKIEAIVVIADRRPEGNKLLETRYDTKVYSVIKEEDIMKAMKHHVI